MSRRTAILSDIHGNSPALEAVLEDVDRMDCENLLILGDIVNGVDPSGVLSLVRSLSKPAVCIRGNAEAYILTPDLDELPDRFEEVNIDLIRLIGWFRDHLSSEELDWLASLPDHSLFQGVCLVHDSPLDRFFPKSWQRAGLAEKYQEWFYHSPGISERLPAERWQELWNWMENSSIWAVFCGHTHTPLVRHSDGKWIANAGGAGFSLDGDPRPSWILMEGEPGEQISISIRRVSYDIDRLLQMVDSNPDYLAWQGSKRRLANKKMFQTGIHWQHHLDRS